MPDLRALSEQSGQPPIREHKQPPRHMSRPLFPVPTAAEAEDSARQVLKTLRNQAAGKTPDQQRSYVFGTLRTGVSPFTFEQMIIQCFAEMGFTTEQPKFRGDGGIDGAIYHAGTKILLQTKRYGAGEARWLVRHLRDFSAVVARHQQQRQALAGFFIHSGRSGLEATSVVEATNGLITMFSGNALVDLLLRPNG